MSTKRFQNKVSIVTGASRGIGQAICVAFAREHAKVIGVARSDLTETATLVKHAGGGFVAVKSDLSEGTQKAAADLITRILKQAGRIDALVNNAGIIRRAPAVDYSEADWDEVLRVNLSAPFFLCQAVAKWWLTRGREQADRREENGGRAQAPRLKIVNIASLLSFQGGITVPAYAASKHGIAGVTKALANEWSKERINVNAIAPGYIATENTMALRADADRNRAILERIPEGRWGKPEDIAGAAVFLASEDADYLNGAILNIDGGWLAR
jgi:2-dehydro-3-deoxy-D-gluconate 5-dehydrogenase